MATWWIDKPVDIEIDGDGVQIALHSGDQSQVFRMSRHLMRHMVESGRRRLDEDEAENRLKVIDMLEGEHDICLI